MDVEYHRIKDGENLREEAWVNFSPVPPNQSANHSPDRCIPPIKPRRSLKLPKIPCEGAGPAHQVVNDQKNETVVKRMSPALTLGSQGPLEPLSPSLRAHTLLWFERTQLPRLRQPGRPLPCWLHGFATRREAEELLKFKPQGCFLLRLSESKIGFVLSYRGEDRCRHFIVEEEEEEEEGGANKGGGSYLIAGEESRHVSLQDLITYYTRNPVGPFDEMLTIPCGDSSGVCADTVKLDKAGADVVNSPEREAQLSPISKTAVSEPATAATSNPVDNEETAQYAVVRKALKKSRSLPGTPPGQPTPPARGEEVNVPNSITQDESVKADSSMAAACGGDGFTADADVQYARVNKPPRPQALPPGDTSPYVNISTLSEQQGAAEPAPVPSACRGSAGDPGYWKLEPLHTYEETRHLAPREQEAKEEIDCYAVGRWRDMEGNADSNHHHLYSEVNLRGSSEAPPDHVPSLIRAAPNLPTRPPPTAINCPSQQEAAAQRGADPLLMSSSPSRHRVPLPLLQQRPSTHHDSGSGIYERIQERPAAGSRPPLPPPNPKRNP